MGVTNTYLIQAHVSLADGTNVGAEKNGTPRPRT